MPLGIILTTMAGMQRIKIWKQLGVLAILCALGMPRRAWSYSVIMHEAIIDAEWETQISPLLHKRFPHATPDEIRLAKSYAYGGSVIQDLGYYPFGSHFFSELTHYVRTGDFVQALFQQSRDLNDFAFALGALSHYCADIKGHSLGVNLAEPLLYPRLRRKYGDVITWEENPPAHIMTEFGFDTVEVVAAHVAPQKYHEWIGFRVAQPALIRAFRQTYGLSLPDQTVSLRLALASYRETASRLVPGATMVAWALKPNALEQRATSVHHRSVFHLRRPQIDQAWENTRRKPGPGDKFVALLFRIVPKAGPFYVLKFHVPIDQTEKLVADSLRATIALYEQRVQQMDPPEINLDTGLPTQPGDYEHCDKTYAKLLERLQQQRFSTVSPALRANLLTFFRDTSRNTVRREPRKWRRVMRDLAELKDFNPPAESTEYLRRED